MLNLRTSSPNPGIWSSTSNGGKFVELNGEETGLATVEGTCELPLEAVVAVDVDVVVRSIWAVALFVVVARSSIFALTRLRVRMSRASFEVVDSSSVRVAGVDVWEKMYELGEGTNVALAKRMAVETEGSTIAAIDGLSCFLWLLTDFGRSALDYPTCQQPDD